MQSVISAFFAAGSGVANRFSLICPAYFISLAFHIGYKFRLVFADIHCSFNGVYKPELPTVAESCRRIFAVRHCLGRFLLLVFYNRKTVFGTYFIGDGSNIFKRFFILMKFLSAFKTDTVYDDVIVQMIFFNVRSDDYFIPVKTFFCESDADFVYGFRCDFFFRTERLTVVIKVSAVRL